ncbi:MAG TPA: EAL domain-containing protein [Nitrospirae bacterium]|nr:EAL domain-containing protein [Nitrospirota bacterium]
MELFAEKYGGLSAFDIHDSESLELPLSDSKGSRRVFHITSVDSDKEKILLVRDITELNEQRTSLEQLALHDPLTGIPNRALFYNRLEHAILVVRRENRPTALLMLDIDGFKEINDSMGHDIGDQVLKQVAERLPGPLRKSDTVARFGGDEFVILLPTADIEQANRAAGRLLSALEQPFNVGNASIHLGASIGIVLCPEHGEDADTLIQRADAAVCIAKQTRSAVVIYNPRQDRYSRDRLVLIKELRYAIENEELVLHYQPKVNCRTGRINGMEALVRWNHPDHGLIMPNDFIPLAEQTGLIKQLTTWVLSTALQQLGRWQKAGFNLRLSINLSTRNLLDPHFIDEIAKRLEASAIKPSLLELEITESAIMIDPDLSLKILADLDALGIRISIDDFGTGHSSLAYLRKMPVDEIKIDKTFISNILVDNNDAIIVRTIVELAHNLGIQVIAEGVESEGVCDMLKDMGCDNIQGYLISRPIPAEDFEEWLETSDWYKGK